jgi:hypothetical protein
MTKSFEWSRSFETRNAIPCKEYISHLSLAIVSPSLTGQKFKSLQNETSALDNIFKM